MCSGLTHIYLIYVLNVTLYPQNMCSRYTLKSFKNVLDGNIVCSLSEHVRSHTVPSNLVQLKH